MKKLIFYAIVLGVVTQSCKRLDLAPLDRASDLTFWNTQADAVNAVNACYGDLYDAETWAFSESLSDNAYTRSGNGNLVRDVGNGNYDAAHPLMQQVWAQRYAGIRRCNTVLDNIDRVPDLDEGLLKRLKAETRFIRAFHYFTLMNHFGGVPLVEHEISIEESRNVQRADRQAVADFVRSELELAYADLPVNTEYGSADLGRITKGAAMGLLARTHLYDANWQGVIDAAERFFANEAGSYGLFPSYAGLFKPENENNQEVILDVQYMPIRRTHGIQYFMIPPTEGGYAAISPSQELVDSYLMENGAPIGQAGSGYDESNPYAGRDPRLAATVVYDNAPWTRPDGSTVTIRTAPGNGENSLGFSSNTTPTGYYVAKFFDPEAQNLVNSGLNLILLRYADILLMYAEAKNELGQFDEAVWNRTIAALRQRAGFTHPDALAFDAQGTQDTWRDMIRRERRVELAMEGLRIADIRRWRIAENVLNGWLHGMKTDRSSADGGYERVDLRTFDAEKHYLWPIPLSERDRNPNLDTNPGW